jgi:uncharacterized membrane protein
MSDPNVPPPPSYTPPPPSYMPPPPPSGGTPPGAMPPGGVSPNRGLMLVLAYLGILALVPLVVEKNDPEVQWHAKHGLVLFGAWIALAIVLAILMHIPFLGCLVAIGFPILALAYFILIIYMILQAQKGQRVMIPGISDFANRF